MNAICERRARYPSVPYARYLPTTFKAIHVALCSTSFDRGMCRKAPTCPPTTQGGSVSTNQGTPTLYEALHAAGVPLDSHESDLYVKDTPEARAILVAHGKCPGAWGCEAFTSNIEPRDCWFDVPFAFDPYWQQRQR